MAALAAREHMSPLSPAVDRLRIATWNINSLRTRASAVDRFLERARPDVICLQETKGSKVPPEAAAVFDRHGYELAHNTAGAYNGVAIASVHHLTMETANDRLDHEHLDREPRLISCIIETNIRLRVASVYVPHGREVGHWHYDYKLEFLRELAAQVREWLTDGHLVVAGDVNVAPTDSDIFHPNVFVGLTHVTAPEREALQAVLDEGLVDVDAARWGAHQRRFTWWNYGFNYERNLGMRIDIIAADQELASRVDTTWIDHIERGAVKPSDHAALVADFHLVDS